MLLTHIQNHFTRTICISVICICLLSACLGQVPTHAPVTIHTATPTEAALPTSTPTARVPELQVVNWRISAFTCDKNGMVENVMIEVTAEGGTLPYAYTVENIVESNPAATKHVPATDTLPTATPAKKGKNATATPIAPTSTPIPTPLTPPTLLPGQLLVNVQAGVEKITIRSADGQSATLEVIIPSACSELSITPIAPIGTPAGSFVPTSSPQPSATTTQQNLNLPPRPVCSDGLDNDGDGYVDLYDHNCKSKGDQDESH